MTHASIKDVLDAPNVGKWKSAIQVELQFLKANKIWEITIYPKVEFLFHPNGSLR